MNYCMSRLEQYTRDEAYKNYISDTLFYSAQNQHLTVKYRDIFTKPVIDERGADEIAADIIKRAGLVVK